MKINVILKTKMNSSIERIDKSKKYTYATYLASRSNQANIHGWNA
jgi:hypothetical protein